MGNTCIRNIKESDWKFFKTEAAKRGMSLGNFFSELLNEHKKVSKDPWDEILHGKKIFSKKDVEDIKKRCADFRERFRFRKK